MTKPADLRPVCWVVTDGRAGMENQALGLAEAVERKTKLRIFVKRIHVRQPWRQLPGLFWPDPFALLSRRGHLLRPPYPALWIACGRLTAPLTIAVKKRYPKTFTVQTQNPHARAALFDLIIPPGHDLLSGRNVFPIIGAPGRVTAEKIAAAGAQLAPAIAHLPAPRIAALIGGPNKAYRMSDARVDEIARMLNGLAANGTGVIAVTSRRTGDARKARLKAALSGERVFFIGTGTAAGCEDPYLGALGLADHILVTADSVNMACEAAATGKPVHILPLEGGGGKFDEFHRALQAYGASRPFTSDLDRWTYDPLNETARAAAAILKRWDAGAGSVAD